MILLILSWLSGQFRGHSFYLTFVLCLHRQQLLLQCSRYITRLARRARLLFSDLLCFSLELFDSVLDTLNMQLELVLHPDMLADIAFKTLYDLLINSWAARSSERWRGAIIRDHTSFISLAMSEALLVFAESLPLWLCFALSHLFDLLWCVFKSRWSPKRLYFNLGKRVVLLSLLYHFGFNVFKFEVDDNINWWTDILQDYKRVELRYHGSFLAVLAVLKVFHILRLGDLGVFAAPLDFEIEVANLLLQLLWLRLEINLGLSHLDSGALWLLVVNHGHLGLRRLRTGRVQNRIGDPVRISIVGVWRGFHKLWL